MDIEPNKSIASPNNRLSLDPEWLCILSKTDQLLNVQRTQSYLPEPSDKAFLPTADDYERIRDDFSEQFEIPDIFQHTGPIYQSNEKAMPVDVEQLRKTNNQTELLCLMLGIRNPIDVILNRTTSNEASKTVG